MNAPREPHPLETGPVGYGVYVVLRTIVLATFGEFARALLTDGRPNGRSTPDASPAHENPSNVEKQVMSDLIERLEKLADEGEMIHLYSYEIISRLFKEAADELSRLQSLSDQNRLTGGWRDIESAPKDGSLVDVWIAPLAPDGTALTPCRGPDAYCQDGKWYLVGGRTDVRIWHRITHWMPPPAGPPLPLPGGEEKR